MYKNVAGAVAGDVITRAQAQDPQALELLGFMEEPIRSEAIQPKIMGLIGRLYSQYVEEGHPDIERLSRLFFDGLELTNDPYRAWGIVLTQCFKTPLLFVLAS